MTFLRDRWRRTSWHQYFAGLPPIDRATFWIVVALALALGLSASMIAATREPATSLAPNLTAPPFELRFAATGTRA